MFRRQWILNEDISWALKIRRSYDWCSFWRVWSTQWLPLRSLIKIKLFKVQLKRVSNFNILNRQQSGADVIFFIVRKFCLVVVCLVFLIFFSQEFNLNWWVIMHIIFAEEHALFYLKRYYSFMWSHNILSFIIR